MSERGWVAFDLDGTLAHYDGWKGIDHIGAPILPMLQLVREYLAAGSEVRIFTARVCENGARSAEEAQQARRFIEAWCELHIGQKLPVTNIKDFGMITLYDDRAFRVEANTGRVL